MAFMVKKKRFKFHVQFEIEELSPVPLVNGVFFAKLRLQDGGSFVVYSPREEVSGHMVQWCCKQEFPCKMTASATTGVLETCICRVSVRREIKGGKSFEKLGFADVNLAEFAGAGKKSRRYLLEGYDSKRRLDNSTLKVNIMLTLLSGDPLFKVPQVQPSQVLPGEEDDPQNRVIDNGSEGSSGFGSLPRKDQPTNRPSTLVKTDHEPGHRKDPSRGDSDTTIVFNKQSLGDVAPDLEVGHTRNESSTSEQSRGSGYSTSNSAGGHSRQSSMGNTQLGHCRSPSTGSSRSDMLTMNRHKTAIEKRVDETRINNDDLVDELIKGTDFQIDDSAESSGLQLFVSKDGTTALSRQEMSTQGARSQFQKVTLDSSITR